MKLPADHPQRRELHAEAHARPPQALVAPSRITYLALASGATDRSREVEHVAALARRFGREPPAPEVSHFSGDFGAFRVKWERHTEFARYKFIVDVDPDADPFAPPALAAVPADWVEAIPGELMVSMHVGLVPQARVPEDPEAISARWFAGNSLAGSAIGAGAARAYADFHLHDGFGRVLIADAHLTPRQAGRMVQRLVEIDTYRMMALLAFPVARTLAPFLTQCEQELAQVTEALAHARASDEAGLLLRLTRLEAAIESRTSTNHYRFGASAAYHDLVNRRIEELREERLPGLPTLAEFTQRRLDPAMATCRAVSARQESLSQRMARATQLLSTRVGITREGQNQALLESMNRRAKLQLRLQQTVEGLSLAAMTYYLVGLVGYGAKSLKVAGVDVNPDLAMGLSIPVVLVVGALFVRKIRRLAAREGGA